MGFAESADARMRPARVRTGEVVERQVSRGHNFVGTVEAKRTSTVGSTVSGRVIEFLVDEGDEVDQDQPLVKLRTRDLEIDLAVAQAELDLRREELAELENGTRPEEIEQAKARMLAAGALKEFTAARLRRAEQLYARNATSADDLQETRSAAEGAAQRYIEAEQAWRLAVAGPRKEEIAQAKARVRAAEEHVNRLNDDIDEHTVRAPFHGYVTDEFTEVGQWVAAGAAVVEMIDVDTVEVEIPVIEKYAAKVRRGMPARVTVDALPERQWTAQVSAVVPKADRRSRSFPVKIELENPTDSDEPRLRPGMFARVTLSVGTEQPVMLVPKDAVVLGGRTPVVFRVGAAPDGDNGDNADGTAELVPVELGASIDGMIEVRGDLKPGDSVVEVGNERVRPGQPLVLIGKSEE
jgi:RND family efflux transporter MFP subunit